MKNRSILRLLPLAGFSLLLTACAIQESDKAPVGAISVSAIDTSLAVPLVSGRVLVNNIPRAQGLPALIPGLTAGSYTIEVRPDGVYPARIIETVVSPPDTVQLVFEYAIPDTARVRINTNQDARLIVDEAYIEDEPNGYFNISPGVHRFSAWAEGFLTASPSLIVSEELQAGTDYEFTISLEAGTLGNTVGRIAPEFTLPDAESNDFSLGELRGHVVLINFWFVNCAPCREEFPSIEQVYQEYAAEGFRILAVNTGWYTTDNAQAIAAFRDEFNLSFPLLVNQGQQAITNEVYQATQAPTNFLVDQSGVIRYRFGSTTYDDLTTKLETLLP